MCAQDVVCRGGKLLAMYKRNGQRVIVNARGDMAVRPSPIESSLLQMPCGSSIADHFVMKYQQVSCSSCLAKPE